MAITTSGFFIGYYLDQKSTFINQPRPQSLTPVPTTTITPTRDYIPLVGEDVFQDTDVGYAFEIPQGIGFTPSKFDPSIYNTVSDHVGTFSNGIEVMYIPNYNLTGENRPEYNTDNYIDQYFQKGGDGPQQSIYIDTETIQVHEFLNKHSTISKEVSFSVVEETFIQGQGMVKTNSYQSSAFVFEFTHPTDEYVGIAMHKGAAIPEPLSDEEYQFLRDISQEVRMLELR